MTFRTTSFHNDPATTDIYTLSLHDALPICHLPLAVRQDHLYVHLLRLPQPEVRGGGLPRGIAVARGDLAAAQQRGGLAEDRKSTRLNSSHVEISYAVCCLKKKIQKHGSAGA